MRKTDEAEKKVHIFLFAFWSTQNINKSNKKKKKKKRSVLYTGDFLP